jgi:hypothetical protein
MFTKHLNLGCPLVLSRTSRIFFRITFRGQYLRDAGEK